MLRKMLMWCVVLPLIGGVAFLGSMFGSLYLNGGAPNIECPEFIDLGEQEIGHVALARFAVVNWGRKPLLVDQVRSSSVPAWDWCVMETTSPHLSLS